MAHVLLNRSFQGQIYQRWLPGHRYSPPQWGYRGMGEIDPETGLELGTGLPGGGLDFSSGEVDPSTLLAPTTGGTSEGDYLTAWEGSEGVTTATPEEQAAAQAWLLQNIPTDARAGQAAALSKLALSAAQIATGLTAGTVQTVPASSCPSGYKFSAGPCVPGPAGSTPGQWVSFATNKQLITFGVVVVAGLLIVNLIPSGGGGRRRR